MRDGPGGGPGMHRSRRCDKLSGRGKTSGANGLPDPGRSNAAFALAGGDAEVAQTTRRGVTRYVSFMRCYYLIDIKTA